MSAATNFYYDTTHATKAVKLLPGEYFATGNDMLLVTVLGSCVSLCLRDRESGFGGMNHFMLPEGQADSAGTSARYGAYAMEVLINEILKRGGRRERLEAKLFGGGAVLADLSSLNVGERNSQFALDYLKTESIPVAAKDLLGEYPRKVYYFPASGRVRVKTLRERHNDTVLNREREYRGALQKAPVAGEVELFA
jgi:chemotaxis protein CheD